MTEAVESSLTVESYSYDPYGKVTIKDLYGAVLPTSAIGNPYLFTGRELDQETGNYYYRARHYHPGIGRFLQRDPVGYSADNNLYRYVNNSPVNWADPFGLKTKNPYQAPGNQGNFPGGYDPTLPGFPGGPKGPIPPRKSDNDKIPPTSSNPKASTPPIQRPLDPRPKDPSPISPETKRKAQERFGRIAPTEKSPIYSYEDLTRQFQTPLD